MSAMAGVLYYITVFVSENLITGRSSQLSKGSYRVCPTKPDVSAVVFGCSLGTFSDCTDLINRVTKMPVFHLDSS